MNIEWFSILTSSASPDAQLKITICLSFLSHVSVCACVWCGVCMVWCVYGVVCVWCGVCVCGVVCVCVCVCMVWCVRGVVCVWCGVCVCGVVCVYGVCV
jgi:hypothetical protein